MKYWLLKSEPDVWSIDQQIKTGLKGSIWDGVRNYQAANNLKKMKKGDLCFFYHSNIGKDIVGIVSVIKEAYTDPTDKTKKFVAVDVRLNSPTFGQYYGNILSDNNHFQMYVPPGFAHGYIVISEVAIFQYKCTEVYHPEDEFGIRWDDPKLSIDWKITNPIISNRDKKLPFLSNQKDLPIY